MISLKLPRMGGREHHAHTGVGSFRFKIFFGIPHYHHKDISSQQDSYIGCCGFQGLGRLAGPLLQISAMASISTSDKCCWADSSS